MRHLVTFLRAQDFWAGAIFFAVGLAALLLGQNLTIGTAAAMGEGFFPLMMTIALMALGILIMGFAWFRGSDRLEAMTWRPLLFVTTSILVFAIALERLGLIVAIAASVIAANFAGQPLRLRTLAALVAVLCTGVMLVFVWGLGLPLAALPRFGN